MIKHIMKRDDIYRNWLTLNDICIYCNKSVKQLLDEIILKYGRYEMPSFLERQMYLLNEMSECLTEDEFLIKQIIE